MSVSLSGDASFEAVFTRDGSSVSENMEGAAPRAFSLRPNYPNPFNSSTCIEFDLPVRSSVLLRIFDVHGRIVRILSDRRFETGAHSVAWDGKDSEDGEVPSGVYVCILRAGMYSSSIKILHIR
jgi:hypothetical protein